MSHINVSNRIQGLQYVHIDNLHAHPLNPSTHSKKQRSALRSALSSIGLIDTLIVRKIDPSEADYSTFREQYEVIDGHMRLEELIEACPNKSELTLPCLVVNLTKDEAAAAIATINPIAAMAGTSKDSLQLLLQSVSVDFHSFLEDVLKMPGQPQQQDPRSQQPDPAAAQTSPTQQDTVSNQQEAQGTVLIEAYFSHPSQSFDGYGLNPADIEILYCRPNLRKHDQLDIYNKFIAALRVTEPFAALLDNLTDTASVAYLEDLLSNTNRNAIIIDLEPQDSTLLDAIVEWGYNLRYVAIVEDDGHRKALSQHAAQLASNADNQLKVISNDSTARESAQPATQTNRRRTR